MGHDAVVIWAGVDLRKQRAFAFSTARGVEEKLLPLRRPGVTAREPAGRRVRDEDEGVDVYR